MFHLLRFFFLPTAFLLSPEQIVYDAESLNKEDFNTSSVFTIEESNDIFENYYPLFLLLITFTANETESLEKYLNQRTYAELKRMIDDKKKKSDMSPLLLEMQNNNTDLAELVKAEENKKFTNIVEAYHNASIYSTIRAVWNSQLDPILPSIDQLAILEYFSEKRSEELSRESFWTKLWAAIRAWLIGKKETDECNADQPSCIRRVLENMEMKSRIELDQAASTENFETVESIIFSELQSLPTSASDEFKGWKRENSPPLSLLSILNNTSEIETLALQRLRKHDLIHSIKDYYRAVIETKSPQEQKEIHEYFKRMNESFARCFNPIREKYEFYS